MVRKDRHMRYYLEVTKDEYELPICVAESVKELAKMTGADPRVIHSTVWHWKKGDLKHPRFVCTEGEE